MAWPGWIACGTYEEASAAATAALARFETWSMRLLSRAATLIDQFDDITRDGLVLSPETTEAIGRAEQHRNRWTSVALWTIAALLAWAVWKLI